VSKFKKLDESIHKPLYDKMHEKLTQNKAYHRRLVKRRSSTVEPILGTLINHHNMKRINSRGMAQANKHTSTSSVQVPNGSANIQPEKVSKIHLQNTANHSPKNDLWERTSLFPPKTTL